MSDHATDPSMLNPTSPVSATGSYTARPAGAFANSGGTIDEDTPMENNQPNTEPVAATENITNGHSQPTSASKTSQPTAHANDSLGQIGAGVKVLMHAINDLARHGIDNTIPLPKIVVVGDQSAGKSSLIEAIRLRTKLNDNATTWLTLPVRSKCLGMWVHALGFVFLSRHLEVPVLTILSALCKLPS